MNVETNNICAKFKELIRTTLVPLIPGDYILLDLPYYCNIGDILIWKGTEELLKELPGKCLGRHSKETFDFRLLPADCTILLLGGGNFGDLWRQHQEFRLEVMRLYGGNRIVVLPQTIHYESDELFVGDVKKMNRHHHLTICARDAHSAQLLSEKGFTGRILTLPDMAFCININELKKNMAAEPTQQSLFLLRDDKEIKEPESPRAVISDWPDMQESGSKAWHYLMTHKDCESDSYFIDEFFPQQIQTGVEFVSSFMNVCSTRLHVSILRLLLGLPVKMFDNSYGKNLHFYDTWLKGSELVSLPNEGEQIMLDLATLLHRREMDFKLIKERYETQMEDCKREMQEKESRYDEILQEQRNENQQLRQSSDRFRRKYLKYKKLFIWTLIVFSILLAVLTLLFILN